MSEHNSTLIAHCGARKVTRDELKEIAVPEATRTHQPLSHYEIINVLEEALSFRSLRVVRDEYAISPDGMKMFGVMDLNTEFSGCRFSVGLRNSNDKSMRFALTVGYRVFVCDNMAFSGDFNPLFHKHTRNLALYDAISIAVDRIYRGFEPLESSIRQMKELEIHDEEAKLLIYQAFLDRRIKGIPRHLMPLVHDLYFEPQYEAFRQRNFWSLSNAFTSAFKKLAPVKQFEVTAKLGAFLNKMQEDLINRQTLNLDLSNREVRQLTSDVSSESFNPISSDNFIEVDEDEIPEDPYDDFDQYFDQEESEEVIDEATERIVEKYEEKAA